MSIIRVDTPKDKKITKLALKLRMTTEERNAIRELAKTNADANDFMDLLADAEHVDLNRAETIAGITLLFSPSRAAEILDAPINELERWKE